LLPLEPRRYTPTAERPVRAKARRLEADTEILPHSHPWAQVAISVSGVARITAGHSTYLVPAWRAVWIPPAIEHVVTAVETAELRTLYVHQDARAVGPGVRREQRDAWRGCRVLEVSALLRELVLQMDIGMDGPEPPEPDLLARERRLGELALDELRRAAPVRLGIELPQDKRLRALCEAVLADPSRHATLEGWATDTGASTRTVARLFRQQLGTSFGPWRQQVLLARALTLAAQGKPMGVIAADLGYASASAFTAMVRRSVGAPPGRFFAAAG
jgi:AraC-like DNA-binding protein